MRHVPRSWRGVGWGWPHLVTGTGAYHDVTSTPTGPGTHLDAAGPAGTPQPGSPTTPYLIALGLDQTLTATPGYDDTTGVGTPGAQYFASYERPRP